MQTNRINGIRYRFTMPMVEVLTHEGAPAATLTPYQQLRRSVLATMLFEDQFYEDGKVIAERIQELVRECTPDQVAELANICRNQFNIRHTSLWLARELARHPRLNEARPHIVADTIDNVIQRADELCEFLALYWKERKQSLSKQVKHGLRRAFHKFNAYQLQKYNRDKAIKLLDVMRLVHPKPANAEQAEMWGQLRDGTLPTPETWEVLLSRGDDKKATFTHLIETKQIGGLAMLRNLRNMLEAKVDKATIVNGLNNANMSRVLPFRYLTAARYAPSLEPVLDTLMLRSMKDLPKLPGKTVLLVDVSGSMVGTRISKKSELDRLDAAAALAVLVQGQCERSQVFVFSDYIRELPPRTGMALVDAIRNTNHSGTRLGEAVQAVNRTGYDRIVVFTDEQSHDPVGNPCGKGYMVNVASYQNAVGYGDWIRIDGFSEAVIDYIIQLEGMSE